MQLLFWNTEKLPNSTYFQAIAHFFKGQYEKSLRLVRTVMKRDAEEKPYDLQKLVYFYIVPFKNAFPGFWQMVVLQLSNLSLNMPNWFGIIISLLQRKKNVCC